MNHFVLDFSEVTTVMELHQYLKNVFSFPDYYGNNMDAMWDCLSCCYNENTTIELRNLGVLCRRLEQTAKTMLEVFQDLHNEDGVIIKIVEDETNRPKTSFDTINDDLLGYLFNTTGLYTHTKEKLFAQWGYTVDDARWLQAEMERQAREKYLFGEYTLGELNDNGQRISIRISIPRRDTSEIVSFVTGWMVYPDGRIQLTTPYGGK